MARKSGSKRGGAPTSGRRTAAKSAGERRTGKARRFAQFGEATSQIVKEAAALLDDEVAAGVVAAKQMQDRFKREQRLDPSDFQDSMQRFQNDAHEVVTLLDQQFAEVRSNENAELVSRLLTNAHDLVDVLVGVVSTGVDVANQLLDTNLEKPESSRARPKRDR
jgi:hypothetical protein